MREELMKLQIPCLVRPLPDTALSSPLKIVYVSMMKFHVDP